MAVALSGVMVMSPQACAPTHTESTSPAPVAIAASGATSMTITWSAIGGARSYDLVYAGTGLAGPITVTRLTTLSRTISGLTPGGRYEARVRAVTRRGRQPWSTAAVVTLTAAAATPAQENPVVTAAPATPAPTGPVPAPAPIVPATTAVDTTAPATVPPAPPTTAEPSTTVPTPPPTTVAPTSTAPPVSTAPPTTPLVDIRTAAGSVLKRSDGVGAFRTTCTPSHRSSDDPIVAPGRPGASHLHQFFGNRHVDAYSTTMTSVALSTCAGGTANQSGYWVPAMLDDGVPVEPGQVMVYYKAGYRGVRSAAIENMPPGLRMVAGSATNTTVRPVNTSFTSWQCLKPDGYPSTERQFEIHNCPVGHNLVMTVEFPQCWNGRDLDSPDHTSHMAYGTYGVGCPATHPHPIPVITFNVYWKVATDTVGWRLSSDMYTGQGGRSAHADWWNGWDPAIAATWIEKCVRAGLNCTVNNLGDGRRLD